MCEVGRVHNYQFTMVLFFQLDKERNFYVIYPKFSMSEVGLGIHIFHLKSETPKESSLGQKWKYISKSSSTTTGVERLAAEESLEEEPLLVSVCALLRAHACIRAFV